MKSFGFANLLPIIAIVPVGALLFLQPFSAPVYLIAVFALVFGWVIRECICIATESSHEKQFRPNRIGHAARIVVRLLQGTAFFAAILWAWSFGTSVTPTHSLAAGTLAYVGLTTIQNLEWGITVIKRGQGRKSFFSGGGSSGGGARGFRRVTIIVEEYFSR